MILLLTFSHRPNLEDSRAVKWIVGQRLETPAVDLCLLSSVVSERPLVYLFISLYCWILFKVRWGRCYVSLVLGLIGALKSTVLTYTWQKPLHTHTYSHTHTHTRPLTPVDIKGLHCNIKSQNKDFLLPPHWPFKLHVEKPGIEPATRLLLEGRSTTHFSHTPQQTNGPMDPGFIMNVWLWGRSRRRELESGRFISFVWVTVAASQIKWMKT